jgi:hypothetical protein
MIWQYLIAIGVILVATTGWLLVQALARRFATRHPEFGPAREEGGGCGSGQCGSCGGHGECPTPDRRANK